jgi:hypothetical protein
VPPREKDFSSDEHNQLTECILRMESLEAISKVEAVERQFISPIFVVPKPDGSGRFILNLKELNSYMNNEHFKMEYHRTVISLRRKDWYMAKIDLQDAYYSVPVATKDRKYLGFIYKGQLYQFNCLPFGLCTAPQIFTKIMIPVLSKTS